MIFERFIFKTKVSEKGAAMLEAAFAMPIFLSIIFFLPAVIPFMFNMVGTHYASTISLREITATGIEGDRVGQLRAALERNLASYTLGVKLDDIEISVISYQTDENNNFIRQVNKSSAEDLNDIPPGSFVIIEGDVKYMSGLDYIGLNKLRSRTFSIMKMQEWGNNEGNADRGTS